MSQLTLSEYADTPKINQIRQHRWITLEEQAEFVKFLDDAGMRGLSAFEPLKTCAKFWEKYRCSLDANHTHVTRYLACGRRGICPRCSMSYASGRAEIMYQWIKRNIADKVDFDLKMNQIVLTLPESLHGIDQKKFARMVRTFMFCFGFEAYGYTIQTRHSSDPLGEKYTHAHVVSLNIKVDDPFGNFPTLVKNDYFFDVDLMRECWKIVITMFTKEIQDGEVDLFTEYVSILNNKEGALHILKYVYRYPIADLFQVQIRDKSINYVQNLQFDEAKTDESNTHTNTLQIDVSNKVRKLIEEPKPRLIWCGLLTSTKRKLLQNLLGVSPSCWSSLELIRNELDTRAKNCRDCGSPLEDKPFDRGEYFGDNEPFSRYDKKNNEMVSEDCLNGLRNCEKCLMKVIPKYRDDNWCIACRMSEFLKAEWGKLH